MDDATDRVQYNEDGRCIGWTHRTLGGFFRAVSTLGFSCGPFATEDAAAVELHNAWRRELDRRHARAV